MAWDCAFRAKLLAYAIFFFFLSYLPVVVELYGPVVVKHGCELAPGFIGPI